MLDALGKAFAQIDDKAIRRLILRSLGIAGLSLVATLILASALINRLVTWESWWGGLIEAFGLLGAFVLAWFTFPILAAAFAGLFADPVADAIEARHYPGRPAPLKIGFGQSLIDGLKLMGIALLGNLLVLPFLIFPPLYAAIAYLLNGYLLGREYFEMVALRRLEPEAAKALFRRRRGTILMAGIIIALFSTLPIVNLVAPIFAIAFMVHIFETVLNRKGA